MSTDPLNLDAEPIPLDQCLIEGVHLMHTARAIKCPYRVAQRPQGSHKDKTEGIVVYRTDKARFEAALKAKDAKKKYPARP
jgi:hypothetical protein